MASLNFNVNDAPVDESDEFSPLPAGVYEMEVNASAVNDNKAGTGCYLKVELAVTRGDYKGRLVFDYINFQHEKEQVAGIGKRQLASLIRACGKTEMSDSSELHGVPMRVKLAVEKAKPGSDYGDSNRVKKYMPLEGGASGDQALPF